MANAKNRFLPPTGHEPVWTIYPSRTGQPPRHDVAVPDSQR